MIRLFIPGIPKPKGSVSAFPYKRKDGTVGTSIVHRAGAWEGTVATAASEQWPHPPLQGAVTLRIRYFMPRPKTAKPSKRPHPHVRPDIDKLERAVLDGLAGVVFADDAQVVAIDHRKVYADVGPPGVEVVVID